ncbi:dihydrofolate reductase family protein [Crossiella sp. S99.2]|uniref:dihydrofolate reductase family protein n=1 Tax=Crossiella sp. S99.2 TaxID=2936272 RepID=UPI0035ABDDA6
MLRTGRGLDVRALLAGLYERGVQAVLLERGPTLAGSFVSMGVIDRVINYGHPRCSARGSLVSETRASPPWPTSCAWKWYGST